MKYLSRNPLSIFNVKDPYGMNRLKYRRIGSNLVKLSAVLVCLFAFSNNSNAQSGFEQSPYEPCDAGFERSKVSSDCVMKCPPGFTDLGLTCGKPSGYDRGAGHAGTSWVPLVPGKTAIENCEEANRKKGDGNSPAGQKCEMVGLLAYPKCKSGYTAAGPNFCSPNCPPGSTSIGAVCSRPSRKAVPRQIQRDIVNPGLSPNDTPRPQPTKSQEQICRQNFTGARGTGTFSNRTFTEDEVNRLCTGAESAPAIVACFRVTLDETQDFDDTVDACGVGHYSSYWENRAKPRPVREPKPIEPSAPDLTGWTVCASEGGRCQFDGTAEVRYGVLNKWNIQTVTNGVDCNNTVFGDPASGLAKQCLLSPVIVPNAPPDVNTRDANGNNDLHLAVSRNDLPAVNDLLNLGIEVNALNNANETPVTLAVEFDNTPALLAMLARGGDMNAALNRIVDKGNEGMFRWIATKFPIRMTNEMFDRAVSSGAIGIALMSLNYGVDPNRAMGHGIYSRNIQMIDAALAAGANSDTALIFAIENRMPDLILRSLDQYRANPKLAMELSIPKNDPQTLTLALDRGANPTIGLPLAVKASNAAMVETLLTRGADANSGLMLAVESGNDKIIDMLLSRGADPNPAMVYAVERQNVLLVRRLIAAKAEARDQLILGNAGRIGNLEIINMLIDAGGYPLSIVVGSIEAKNYDLTKYLLDRGADAAFGDLIDASARNGDIRITNLLLERGADPNKGILGAVQSGNPQLVQLLIDKKAGVSDPKLIATAAEKGDFVIVVLLLKGGAVPENGMKAAVTSGFAEIVGLLAENGADAKKPEYILRAVTNGNRFLASQLLLHGAPKDITDETGQPLIIIAALRWDTLLVDTLLKNGVDPNAKNRAGDTALHIVANDQASKGYPKFEKMKKGRLPMVQALVDGGANVNATNAKGETVRKSLGGGDGDVKKILDAAGAVNKIGEK